MAWTGSAALPEFAAASKTTGDAKVAPFTGEQMVTPVAVAVHVANAFQELNNKIARERNRRGFEQRMAWARGARTVCA
jgi:cell pole-organizing protein PopZ